LGRRISSMDAARPSNGAAYVHPLAVDALCAPPNNHLQPTVAAADTRHRYVHLTKEDKKGLLF